MSPDSTDGAAPTGPRPGDAPFVSERFRILRHLGAGGMGEVYEAYDAELDARVALKTLRRHDAQALARFKREFRALQGLQHPNLVSLGGLFEEDGLWFFTMDLVEGVDFLTWVRGSGKPSAPGSSSDPTPDRRAPAPPSEAPPRRPPCRGPSARASTRRGCAARSRSSPRGSDTSTTTVASTAT